MIFPVAHLLSYISHKFSLSPGDLVLTGTPAGADCQSLSNIVVHFSQSQELLITDMYFSQQGVGPVVAGDVITAGLGDLVTITFPVVA